MPNHKSETGQEMILGGEPKRRYPGPACTSGNCKHDNDACVSWQYWLRNVWPSAVTVDPDMDIEIVPPPMSDSGMTYFITRQLTT